MHTTIIIIIESACRVYDIHVWERMKSYYYSLNLSCLHVCGREINCNKISFFSAHVQTVAQMRKVMVVKMNTSQTLALLRMYISVLSGDWDKAMNKNLQQL